MLDRDPEPLADATMEAFDFYLAELNRLRNEPIKRAESPKVYQWLIEGRTVADLLAKLLADLASVESNNDSARQLLDSTASTLKELSHALHWKDDPGPWPTESPRPGETEEAEFFRRVHEAFWRPLLKSIAEGLPLIEMACRQLLIVRPLVQPLAELKDEDARYAAHQTTLRSRVVDLSDKGRRAFHLKETAVVLILVGLLGILLPVALLAVSEASRLGLVSVQTGLQVDWLASPIVALTAAILAASKWVSAVREVASEQDEKHSRIRDGKLADLSRAIPAPFRPIARTRGAL